MVEKHAYFRHLAIKELVNEAELLRSRQAIIGEMADVLPEAGVRIRIAQTDGGGHGARRKQAEQPWACPAAANLAAGARLKITVEHRGRRPTKGRLRRKAIDHRHVLEDMAHAVTVAFTVPLVQHPRQPLRIRLGVPGADETSRDLGRRAAHRFGVERVAAEEIDLFELREQSRTGVAARRALHLVDGQKLARVQPIRIELGAVVEMAGDEENVASDTLAAGRFEPVGAAEEVLVPLKAEARRRKAQILRRGERQRHDD